MARIWTLEQGLPQNSANAILQTRDGYLWIATDFGLARFDGVRFQTFNRLNTRGGLKSNVVWSLHEDRSGTLWIGTVGGGLSKYEHGAFQAFTTGDGLAHDAVHAIFEDKAGTLWIGTRGGLTRLVLSPPTREPGSGQALSDTSTAILQKKSAASTGRFTTYTTRDGLPDDLINALYVDRRGTLWIGTESGLARFDGRVFSQPSGVPEAAVQAITEDPDGSLWFGTNRGLLRYAEGTFTRPLPELGESFIFALCIDREGTLWLGLEADHLQRYREGQLVSYPTGPEGHRGPVWSLLEDHEGNLWAGTSGYGLLQLRRKIITHVTTEDGLAHNLVRPILEDRAGTLWIGTRGGYLHRLRGRAITPFTEADGLPRGSISSLAEDQEGTLWIGTMGGGIARFKDGTFVRRSLLDAPSFVQALYADRHNRLWIGTDGQGLFRRAGDTLTHFTTDEGLPHNTVRAILEAPAGTLWFGTGGGLVRYRNGTLTTFTETDGLSDNHVVGLSADPDGEGFTLWIGTAGGGITRFKNGTFSACDLWMIPVDDGRGYLWAHVGDALVRVSKQALNDCADGKGAGVPLQLYGREAGLRGEANSGFQPVAWRSRDGRLWFPTTMGVAIVDPDHIPRDAAPPPVVIEQVLVGREPVALDAPVVLKPGQHQITVHYTGLSFTAPERVRFKYKLEGLDPDWVDGGTHRTVYYPHVPAGNYTFRVKAANHDGIWNEQGAALRVSIRPHFYQTRLFYLLCALVFAALGLGFYRLRVRQLKTRQQVLHRLVEESTRALVTEKKRTEEQARRLAELDEMKSRFFANISHEFRTPLTLITGPLRDALESAYGPTAPALRRQHALMLKHAQRLLRLVNQLLDLSKLESGRTELNLEPGDFARFLQALVRSFAPFAERRRITLTYRAEQETLPLRFDRDKLEKIFSNLLANALKFTPEHGKVWVMMRLHPEPPEPVVEVIVKDTGPGIPKEALPRLFDRFYQVDTSATRAHEGTGIGLALAKELVELHGGKLLVESEEGFGTTFFVRLPQGKAHPQPEAIEEGVTKDDFQMSEDEGRRSNEEGDTSPALDQEASAALRPSPHDTRCPVILIVDDNSDVRAYLRSHLEADYHIVEAADGAAGLEAAQATMPDLVLSDVMMPRMDGFAFCHALKADERLRHVPVVLITARADEPDAVQGLTHGADDYIAKPFSTSVLKARVARLIASRRELRRQFSREVFVQPSEIAVQPAEAAFLERVLAVVEAHMADSAFGADALADEVGLSRRQLTRKLKTVTGQTPAELIRHLRLRRATQLLQGGAGTMAEVAYRVGFQSPSQFARVFRKAFGTSPSAYVQDET